MRQMFFGHIFYFSLNKIWHILWYTFLKGFLSRIYLSKYGYLSKMVIRILSKYGDWVWFGEYLENTDQICNKTMWASANCVMYFFHGYLC